MTPQPAAVTDRSAVASVPRPVAETMRRVHEELRRGAAPSFEALLAHGQPGER